MRTQHLALMFLIVAATSAAFAANAPGPKSYPIQLTQGSRIMVAAKVNGVAVDALLDSGAEASLLDRAFAERVGLTGGKDVTARGSGENTMKASLIEGVKLEALGLTLENQTVGVLDLSDVGKRLFGHRLDIILGREIFDNARLEIDIDGKTIRVVDAAVEPRGVKLPLQSSFGIETFPVTIEGQTVQATFDIGNGTRPMVGGAFAKKLLGDGRPVQMDEGGGIGGARKREVIDLATVEFAGKRFEKVSASVDASDDNAHDANIGISLLRHYLITVDYEARSLWLQPK